MLAGGCIQIGGDNRKGALHIVDDVAPVGVEVADQNPPTRVFAGICTFTPEAQNENLIEQWSL
jgi:hypothetical protein